MNKILELFSGTASFSKAARSLECETLTLDNNPIFNADICIDILKIENNDSYMKALIEYNPDIIWASPPCETFSVASIGTNWTGGKGAYIPKTINSMIGIERVLKTIDIIKELEPKYWFIENPRGLLRMMPFMQEFKRYTITYCQYGDTRMKPTDIWTNCFSWTPRPMCKNGDSCHEKAPRGSKTGTQGIRGSIGRSVVPEQLCYEILQNLKMNYKSN
jgi:hypothetical protein